MELVPRFTFREESKQRLSANTAHREVLELLPKIRKISNLFQFITDTRDIYL